jgi:tRNA dimethylallyltransferase
VGPTAVGKTAAAIQVAQQYQTKIISADSRQCFTELKIGVARPSPEELSSIHHYFIASHSIQQEVNAAIFEELALQWTREIFQEQTGMAAAGSPTAVMVGGTGLYIRAFAEGLDDIPSVDPQIRGQIQQRYEEHGLAWLQEEVRRRDAAFYGQGEILNPSRLLRALEVVLGTGQSILSFRTREPKPRPFRIRKIGLQLPKEELHRRIHERVDRMMDEGLVEEVKGLLPYRENPALRTVGYSEIFEYLDGRISLSEAVSNIKTNTRQYAKRQMTWFKKDPGIQWVDAAI